MIAYDRLRGADGVLVVRDTATSRTERLDSLIRAERWTARLMFSYGCLVVEVWGSPDVLATIPDDETAGEYITIEQAAAELGITTSDLVECMIRDGLLIELDGEIVMSPHPAIRKMPPADGEHWEDYC